MACKITKSKSSIACKDVVSGMKNIYFINYDDVYNDTFEADNIVPFITTAGTQIVEALEDVNIFTLVAPSNLGKVFKYAIKNTGDNLQQTISSNRDNGTTSYTQVLTFILTRLSAEMEYELKLLAWGRPIVIVELNTGQFVMLGKNNGCEITGTSGVAGAIDGLNGYSLTATATERSPIFYLATDAVTTLLDNINTVQITETPTPED